MLSYEHIFNDLVAHDGPKAFRGLPEWASVDEFDADGPVVEPVVSLPTGLTGMPGNPVARHQGFQLPTSPKHKVRTGLGFSVAKPGDSALEVGAGSVVDDQETRVLQNAADVGCSDSV